MIAGFYFNRLNCAASLTHIPVISNGIDGSERTPRLTFFGRGSVDKPIPPVGAISHKPPLIFAADIPSYVSIRGVPIQSGFTNVHSEKIGDRISFVIRTYGRRKF